MGDLRGFRYALEPLRKKCNWELQELSLKLARINEGVAKQQALVDAIDTELVCINAELLRSQGADAVIYIDRQRVTHEYLMHLHARLTTAQLRLQEIEQERDGVMADTHRLKKYADGLDEHREDALHDYAKELGKLAIIEADDAWLRSAHWRLVK